MSDLIIGQNGWLTPDADFIPAEPGSPIHYPGMPHSGHSKVILEWLDIHRPDLVSQVEKLIPNDGDIIDVPRQTVIDVMVKHGFVRVVDEGETLRYEGNPNALQTTIMGKSAKIRGQTGGKMELRLVPVKSGWSCKHQPGATQSLRSVP